MGFDAGTELLEHGKPREAIIFSMEGEDVV